MVGSGAGVIAGAQAAKIKTAAINTLTNPNFFISSLLECI
jgi:hypothetical protein